MKLSTIKRNITHSEGGVWWDFQTQDRLDSPNEHLCVLVAEDRNPKHRDCVARLTVSKWPEIKEGGDRAERALRELETEAMAEAILLDWANLDDDDGKPVEYSVDAAAGFLRDPSLYPFRQFVRDVSRISASYLAEREEQAAGN